MPSTEERVLTAMAKGAGVPRGTLTLDSTLTDGTLDSVDILNAVFEIEEEFNIEVPEERLTNLRTVQDVVDRVKELVAPT